jgi:hypothetical protein
MVDGLLELVVLNVQAKDKLQRVGLRDVDGAGDRTLWKECGQ